MGIKEEKGSKKAAKSKKWYITIPDYHIINILPKRKWKAQRDWALRSFC